MKKAAVTGGAGFIGSHLAELLAERGYHVIILDDLSSGKMANVEPLLKKTHLEFARGSITDLPLLQHLFKGVDHVFHLAAIPSVPGSIENPLASHEANITGTLNVLLAARDCGVKKVVFASSCAVYGDTPVVPVTEDTIPKPNSPYAVTKLASEYYCEVFRKIYGLSTVCLRYFNVYGSRQGPDSLYAAVIPKFIQMISEGKPPVIYGDGEQSRDFIFVRDVVAANLLAAESTAAGIFNIGTGEKVTLNQLARIILKIMHRGDIKPVYEKERAGDIKHSLADISKARTFGYKPEYTLETGLSKTLGGTLD